MAKETARRSPGALMEGFLSKLRGYLGTQQGVQISRFAPIAEADVSSALLPASKDFGLRNEREVLTLAKAIDQLLQGKVAEAADVLVQRFRAVETAHAEGWGVARHMELIGDSKVSSVSDKELENAAKVERLNQQLKGRLAKSKAVG